MPSDASDKSPPETESEQKKTQTAPKKKIPDWQPLGTVRDSFYELLKQDNRY